MEKTILVWTNIDDVPLTYAQVIDNDDDVDNIAFIPNGMDCPSFILSDWFGALNVQAYSHPKGTIQVGYHA